MSARVLILTAGFGEGHNAAARALALAWDALQGAGTARVADVFALAAPRTNEIARRGYLGLINRAPHAWRSIYAWLDRSTTVFPWLMRAFRAEQRVLAALIAREQPIAICCTYPAYAFLLAALRKTGRCDVPLFNVVTDSISIHSLWWRAGAAGWFLANEDSADVLRRVGIDEQRLHVLGFPVPPFFAAHSSEFAPAELQRGATPRVLCIINSGTRNAAETARTLLTNTPWEVTCTVGRNDALREELQRLAINRTPRADVLGWTNEMPRLLMTHHVVVSKAGGATTQEAIAARCPMLVNQIVPGQEEGNYELLRRHDIGALTETPEAVVRELHRAFEDRGRVWHAWRAALEPLSRPQAARDIAQRVLELAAQPSAPVTNFPRGSDVVSAPRDERASACPRYGDAPVS